MGKLRSSIDNVVKTADVLEKAATSLLDGRKKDIDTFMHTTDLCRGGAESIYMYLMEKFKKAGSKIDAHQNDTLKDVIDTNIAGMLKELASTQARVALQIGERDKQQRVGQALKDNVAKLKTDIVAIEGVIAKKKKKWLTSTKYKNKLKGYEDAVADLSVALNGLDKMLPGSTYGKLVKAETWKFTTGTTVAQIRAACSIAFNEDLKMSKSVDEENAKQFRGRGFGKSLAMMKSWVGEADEMESED
jgi:aryl carrier-like protein